MKQQTKDIPKGYKMTELGPLPEEWEVNIEKENHHILSYVPQMCFGAD